MAVHYALTFVHQTHSIWREHNPILQQDYFRFHWTIENNIETKIVSKSSTRGIKTTERWFLL